MGTPRARYTNQQVIEALTAAKGIQSVAALALGCHRNTVGRYIREEKEVADALSDTVEVNLDLAEDRLLGAITRNEPWAIKFYLATQGRSRGYGRVSLHEHTGQVSLVSDPQAEVELEQRLAQWLERRRGGEGETPGTRH